jgi:HAE1 family hydrophobic/amphiphilic exporter-1
LDWKFIVKVEANKSPDIPLWTIQAKVNLISAKFDKLQTVYWADIKDMAQTWKDMGMAFVVWFILMFAILVFNFGNLKQAFILVATIPLFLTWSILFLLVSSQPLGMLVWIWFFGLIWVWLAHIIYLVNRFNELLEDSEWFTSIDEIIINSVKSRLEPVFLTTTITAIWLLVLASSDDFWRAFALSFAWGLIIWTTITLVFIPSALKILYRKYRVDR